MPRLLASPKQSPEQVVAGAVEDLVSDSQPPLPLDSDDGLAVLSVFEDFYGLREPTADQPDSADQPTSVGLAPFCRTPLLSKSLLLLTILHYGDNDQLNRRFFFLRDNRL